MGILPVAESVYCKYALRTKEVTIGLGETHELNFAGNLASKITLFTVDHCDVLGLLATLSFQSPCLCFLGKCYFLFPSAC